MDNPKATIARYVFALPVQPMDSGSVQYSLSISWGITKTDNNLPNIFTEFLSSRVYWQNSLSYFLLRKKIFVRLVEDVWREIQSS